MPEREPTNRVLISRVGGGEIGGPASRNRFHRVSAASARLALSAFADESERLGHRVPGADVLALLSGEVRPEMVSALDGVVAAGYVTACLTNTVMTEPAPEIAAILGRFDHVIESSKVGSRKPEPAFYEKACDLAGVEPDEVVFLDDLGINLKPARAMGMTTIKVVTPAQAIADLEAIV